MIDDTPSLALFDIAHELKFIAKSLYVSGNDRLSETLSELSKEITDNTQDIVNAEIEAINKRVSDAQQSNRNMMEALFAGMKVKEIGEGKSVPVDSNQKMTGLKI